MLYGKRDATGRLVEIRKTGEENDEALDSLTEEDVLDFLQGDTDEGDALAGVLKLSDLQIIRVIEDLVEVLVRKNVIMLTDLPEEVREKLGQRKKTRQRLQEQHDFTVDDII